MHQLGRDGTGAKKDGNDTSLPLYAASGAETFPRLGRMAFFLLRLPSMTGVGLIAIRDEVKLYGDPSLYTSCRASCETHWHWKIRPMVRP